MRVHTNDVGYMHCISTVHLCDVRHMPYGNIMNLFWQIMAHAFLLTFYSEISLRTWRVLEVFKKKFQNLKFFKNLSSLIVQVRVAFGRIDGGGGD